MWRSKKQQITTSETENTLDPRQRLLEAGARLFSEQGFEAVSIRTLAKEADVNIAMIAYYFGSKEELLKAIFAEKMPGVRSQLEHFQAMSVSPWEKLCLAVDVYVDRILSHGLFTRLMYREMSMAHRPETVDFILQNMEKNWLVLQGFIAEGQDSGLFRREVDVRLLLISFFSTVAQMVNSTTMSARFLNVGDHAVLSDEAFRLRVKVFFKDLLKMYLFERP